MINKITSGNTKTLAGFFSGTGGIEEGFKRAGFTISYANEVDKHATTTYVHNNGHQHHQHEDINKVDFNKVPKTTVVAGGFPCQAFSIAGYRQGFDDKSGRGNLFFKIAEVVDLKRPEVIFLENVKNLVSHDEGKTFKIICDTLEDLGYTVHWQIMNAKEYGNIPQGRERIYIVAFKDKESAANFTFPDKMELKTQIRDLIDFKNEVDTKYYYTEEKYPAMWSFLEESINEENAIYQWRRKYVRKNKSGVSPTLTANMGTGGHNVPLIYTKHGIRKLTPRECFNLMGYDSSFKLPNLADSHLYKQAGNAVVVPVIERIAKQIQSALDLKKNKVKYSSPLDIYLEELEKEKSC